MSLKSSDITLVVFYGVECFYGLFSYKTATPARVSQQYRGNFRENGGRNESSLQELKNARFAAAVITTEVKCT